MSVKGGGGEPNWFKDNKDHVYSDIDDKTSNNAKSS